jgi:Tfp pilus assembly protein PilV
MIRRQQAMTLVETMYAVFITAVSAGVLMAAMPAATMAYTSSADQQHALNLAQKELEAIRNQGFPNLTPTQLANLNLIDSNTPVSANTYLFSQVDSAALDNVATILQDGVGTVRIDTLNANLLKVTVVVSWTSHGTPQSYELSTMMANL